MGDCACGRVWPCVRGCGLVNEIVAFWTDGILSNKGGFVDEIVALWIHGVLLCKTGLVDEVVVLWIHGFLQSRLASSHED